jgi:hypothetical protein
VLCVLIQPVCGCGQFVRQRRENFCFVINQSIFLRLILDVSAAALCRSSYRKCWANDGHPAVQQAGRNGENKWWLPYRLVIYRQKKKTIRSSQIRQQEIMRHFITSNFMAEVLYWLKYRITANLKRHFAANTFRCA